MSGEKTAVAELKDIAQQIFEHQKLRGLSDADLCREYAGLGSTKTYKRILSKADDLSEGLRVGRQLENYKEALLLIEMAAADSIPEPLYEDFNDVARARGVITRALSERGNSRLVLIEGNPGAGKTAICEILEQRWPNIFVRCEVTEIWKDSPMAMLRALLLGVGKREQRKKDIEIKAGTSAEINMPQCADERTSKLIEQLNEQKLIVALDEAHHLGPRTLNLVKTLINQTPSVIIMLAIPTLLRRLETKAYEEARQLTQNRLSARLVLGAPEAGEVVEMLERRGIVFANKKVAHECGRKLEQRAGVKGHWKFVVMMVRKLRDLFKQRPVDAEMFVEALAALERER